MQESFKNVIEAFVTHNLDEIRKFAGWFAKSITLNIMNDNKDELQKLCKEAAYMRSDIEFIEPIKMTKDYYLGYCSAYENVGRKLSEEIDNQENIELVVHSLPKFRLQKIINFLGKQGYVQQNELAKYLEITPSHLWNILNNPSIKELNLFSVRKIGKYAIYGLNKTGKQYFHDRIDQDKKQYSKKQIFELLSLVVKNYDTPDLKDLTEKAKILDEELVKGFYEVLLSNEWSKKQLVYSNAYKSIVQKEIIKMKNTVSINYLSARQDGGQASYGKDAA